MTDEAELIATLIDMGVDIVHLRKPGMAADDYEDIIRSIAEPYRKRIVLHSHFALCGRYGLRGIHRWPQHPIIGRRPLHRSCSCHTIDEVAERKEECDYVFLSPIFNSISKQGYMSAFTDEELSAACQKGIIDSRVVALGGITAESISRLKRWGFGGAAFLGDIWSRADSRDFTAYLRKIKQEISS